MKIYRLENKDTLTIPMGYWSYISSERKKSPVKIFSGVFKNAVELRRFNKTYLLNNPGAVVKIGYSSREELDDFQCVNSTFNVEVVELDVEPIYISPEGEVLFHDKRIPKSIDGQA